MATRKSPRTATPSYVRREYAGVQRANARRPTIANNQKRAAARKWSPRAR